MDRITFDKGTSNEMKFDITTLYERIMTHSITATYLVNVGEEEPFPVLPTIKDPNFTTMEIILDDAEYTPVGAYNYIATFVANYDKKTKTMMYNMEIVNKE